MPLLSWTNQYTYRKEADRELPQVEFYKLLTKDATAQYQGEQQSFKRQYNTSGNNYSFHLLGNQGRQPVFTIQDPQTLQPRALHCLRHWHYHRGKFWLHWLSYSHMPLELAATGKIPQISLRNETPLASFQQSPISYHGCHITVHQHHPWEQSTSHKEHYYRWGRYFCFPLHSPTSWSRTTTAFQIWGSPYTYKLHYHGHIHDFQYIKIFLKALSVSCAVAFSSP